MKRKIADGPDGNGRCLIQADKPGSIEAIESDICKSFSKSLVVRQVHLERQDGTNGEEPHSVVYLFVVPGSHYTSRSRSFF